MRVPSAAELATLVSEAEDLASGLSEDLHPHSLDGKGISPSILTPLQQVLCQPVGWLPGNTRQKHWSLGPSVLSHPLLHALKHPGRFTATVSSRGTLWHLYVPRLMKPMFPLSLPSDSHRALSVTRALMLPASPRLCKELISHYTNAEISKPEHWVTVSQAFPCTVTCHLQLSMTNHFR